jgi:hypothetical protein
MVSTCLSAFGQAPAAQSGTTQAPSAGVTAAVYEAVARYQITTWQLGAHAYCYRVLGQDADRQFLDRLKPLPVKPESECVQKNNKNFTFTIVD